MFYKRSQYLVYQILQTGYLVNRGDFVRLVEDFYQRDTLTVAKELLGKLLVRKINGEELVCKIIETEAYLGADDKACHAYQNKRTSRTEAMFLPGGHAYVYLIYGMYNCLNVVSSKENRPEAVLIRAVEPLAGIDIMQQNRKVKNNKLINLTNGPGKLCQALNIDRNLNGYNLVTGQELFIIEHFQPTAFEIIADRRINVDYAEEDALKPWRFYIKGNPFVSRRAGI